MITELYTRLRQLKINVRIVGDRLDLQAPKGVLTGELLNEIKSNKDELIDLLTAYKGRKKEYDQIAKAAEQDSYPLSSSQRRLWILSQVEVANAAYNMPGSFIFEGNLNHDALTAAFRHMIERHEILRTVFTQNNEGEPVQVILPADTVHFEIPIYPSKSDAEIMEDLLAPFDLAKGPLLRVTLYERTTHSWVFTYVMHHIISDGWSMNVLIRELLYLYNAYASNTTPELSPLALQYKDYAHWQQQQLTGASLQAHRNYWLRQFEGELPVLELPLDKPRPTVKTFNGKAVFGKLDAQLSARIRSLCQQYDATLFIGLLSGLTTLLHRYSGQQDLIIGTMIAGREHADLEAQIGCYLNTLALRMHWQDEITFADLLLHTRQTTLGAYEHQVYPFDQLIDDLQVQHDRNRNPLFDITLILQNHQENHQESGQQLQGLTIRTHAQTDANSKFDLAFYFVEKGDEISTSIVYNNDIFTEETVSAMSRHLEAIFQAATAQPDKAISQLDYLCQQEKQQLLYDFNNTKTNYPHLSIGELFKQQAQKTPLKPALNQLTYQQLDEQSDKLAAYLQQEYQVQHEEPVAILMDRSEQTLIAILGILKAGAAYMPIETDYPSSRKEFLLKDAGIKTLITQMDYMMDLPWFEGKVLAIDVQADLIDAADREYKPVAGPHSLAYIMYTSGSTGTPKGVLVEHRSVVRLVKENTFYTFTGDETILTTGALSFDATTFEFWGTLLNGGHLIICPKDELLDPEQIIKAQNVDTIWLTAGWFHQLIDTQIEIFSTLKTVLAGGDKLSTNHINLLLDKYPHLRIINGYGPTENTTFSLTYSITEKIKQVLVGKPISNSTAYILDKYLQPVPIGMPGEICTGGDGLARAYLNNPELTAQKFITTDYGRLYRTGDLGRWLPDGNIEFMGRKDNQIKIRGFRIEPGEIEAALMEYRDITAAVIHIYQSELVAYYIGEVEIDDLKAFLSDRLPSYMLPSHFVPLHVFPLNANGKVDKKQLPPPTATTSGSEYVPPRNETEQKLAAIWQEILDRGRISVTDNFFDIGGHSLRATRLASQIFKVFEVKIDLRTLFTLMTLEEQAAFIANGRKQSFTAIPPAPVQKDYLVSSSQRRLWILSQFKESNIAYNMPGIKILEGDLNIEALNFAFSMLIKRHEILRTVFRQDENGEPRQYILPAENAALFRVGYADFRGRTDELDDHIRNDFRQVFDLSRGPLLRACLYQETDDRWTFTYVMHHIISDGWSMGILIKELLYFYNAHLEGKIAGLPPLTIHYKDYAFWQRQQLEGESLLYHRNYWLNKMKGELPLLDLPLDAPRGALKTHNGSNAFKMFSIQTRDELKNLCRQHDATLFMGLVAAVSALLYRYTNQDDMIIGTPIAGREHADLEGQIGFYLNTLPLRITMDPAASFTHLLEHTRQTTMDGYEHQVYPFDELIDDLQIKRDISRNALFDIMVILQNNEFNAVEQKQRMNGLKVYPYQGTSNTTSKFDMMFEFVEAADGLILNIVYNTDLYKKETLNRLLDHLDHLLDAIIANPATPVNQLNYLSKEETDLQLHTFNDTTLQLEDKDIIDLFEAQQGDRIALITDNTTLTYQQLNEQANQLAAYLRTQHGVRPDELVGLQLPRNEWLIISMLAILKAGGAYVPVDLKYPQERINYIYTDSKCNTIIDEAFIAKFRNSQHLFDKYNLPKANTPDNLAYIIYTSGSTGQPKGVMIRHSNVFAFISWCAKEFRHSNFDITFCTTSVCFDLSVFEIFYTLAAGKTIRLLQDALSIPQYLLQHQQVLLNTVPSVLGALLKDEVDLHAASVLNLAGEPLPPQYVQSLDLQHTEVRNLYGPSEDTTYSTVYKIKEEVLIGKPIANTQVYILSENLQLIPVGFTGEICLSGAGLAKGYLNKPELTAEKFVPHPFRPGERLYKTGDLGRWLPDGNIAYAGRKDDQVKIRGYRIEPGEVENTLRAHPAITDAVVIAKSNRDKEKELVAYYVTNEPVDVRNYLKERLPAYTIPAYYIQLDALPLNANGKIDKKQLPDPHALDTDRIIAPQNETEQIILGIWKEILIKENISTDDNFFESGGHSLSAMRLQHLINKRTGFNLKLQDIYHQPTIQQLAQYKATQDTLLRLNTPAATAQDTIYFIPPVSGNAVLFKPLADQLSDRYACYGLQYKGLEHDEAYYTSIQEAAADCCNRILAHATTGDFIIAGYSMGAYIAFEVAKLLEAKQVSFKLFLFDASIRNTPTHDTNIGLLQEKYHGDIDFLSNNLRILNQYVTLGKLQSPIYTIEAHDSVWKCNMKNWSAFTENEVHHAYISGTHWDVFNENNLPAIDNTLRTKSITLLKTEI